MLNNFAFGYNISVPVHIILRSGGSLMSMLVGYACGKRYTNMQIFSVAMLTAGIITAAMADAQSKVKCWKRPYSSHPPGPRILVTVSPGQSYIFYVDRLLLHNRSRNPCPRPNPVGDNGPLHPTHIRILRLPLARKSLLQPLPLPPAFPPLLPLSPLRT